MAHASKRPRDTTRRAGRLSISPKPPFSFEYTACSHGWVALAPNHWDPECRALRRVERLSTGKVVSLSLTGTDSVKKPRIDIEIQLRGRLSAKERREIINSVSHMFRVDEDLDEFYVLCTKRGGRWAKVSHGLGRLMRSPTFFEDAVKTICTTNIQWGGTKRMVTELVAACGQTHPDDHALRAFPTPQAIAALTLKKFSRAVNMGYRTPYVHTLATRISSGDLDVTVFTDPDVPTTELRKELLAIKGVGPYAATNLLMLLGRYDELAVDTVFRQFVSRKYFSGKRVSDKKATAIYERWGRWKYLAYWFDIWSEYQGQY
jgi:3-methyladenine DNA glycosylase/8-oxoguanine DNA glycosylase